MTTYSALDPTFGQRGQVIGAVDDGSGTALSAITAVAVQADGRVVVAGTAAGAKGIGAVNGRLVVRRYNTDGSVDPSFGTGGQAVVPLPSNASGVLIAPHDVVVASDGSILLAATLDVPPTHTGQAELSEGIVVRLKPTGQLDPTFGTNGEFVITPNSDGSANLHALAVQGDGRIVVAGESSSANGLFQPLVIRLTTAGTPDPTFNGTGSRSLATGQFGLHADAIAVAIAPGGQILVASNAATPISKISSNTLTAVLSRLNADGSTDPAFGPNGSIAPLPGQSTFSDLAVQTDGKPVLVGTEASTSLPFVNALTRLNVDGSVDPKVSFQLPQLDAFNNIRSSFTSVLVGPGGAITVGGDAVLRFHADGTLDQRFGFGGRAAVGVVPDTIAGGSFGTIVTRTIFLAQGLNGQVVAAGGIASGTVSSVTPSNRAYLARLLPVRATSMLPNDYDGDGKSDVAAYVPTAGVYAIRPSGGGADILSPFGNPGVGGSIPAPGDYDGDGVTDVAVYLPALGAFAITPSALGYDPLNRYSTSAAAYLVRFGSAGPGASIPVAGDFDGDGRTDVAVYLPASGNLAVLPSGGAAPSLTAFGSAGAGASIPVAGDFDGDGRTDVAVYLPAAGAFAIRPSTGAPAYLAPFGIPGAGATIPAPGDYDGDGKTDLAAYLPRYGVFAYRPSSGGPDVLQAFGIPGTGQTIPVASLPAGTGVGPTVAAAGLGAASATVFIPLTDDLLPEASRKHRP